MTIPALRRLWLAGRGFFRLGRKRLDLRARIFLGYPHVVERLQIHPDFDLFPNPFEQLAEFVRRLVVNILIGNGDAHLKNWSVIYKDKITPQLAPAYDLVSTIPYVANDTLALKLAGERRFTSIDETHFDRLARRMEAPPKFVLNTVKETVATARNEWPRIVLETGLPEDMRDRLFRYWSELSGLLRITQ